MTLEYVHLSFPFRLKRFYSKEKKEKKINDKRRKVVKGVKKRVRTDIHALIHTKKMLIYERRKLIYYYKYSAAIRPRLMHVSLSYFQI